MRRMPLYHNCNRQRMHRVPKPTRRARAFNDNQGYQQGYQSIQNTGQSNISSIGNNNNGNNDNNTNTCPSAVEYIGNVFLLGLTTLVGELVDLQAANALNVLLQPFQSENNGSVQQEILAGDVQDNDIIDLLDGLL